MDITPLDFSFLSILKRKISSKNVETIEQFIEAINIVMNLVPKEVIINMCLDVAERCRKCIKMEGWGLKES